MSSLTASAIIDINVSLGDISGVFKFYTDISNTTDINISTSNIQYQCISGNWTDINVSNYQVSVNKIGPYSNSQVYNDVVRYLAKELFSTYVAVDIFQNENALKNAVISLNSVINNSIKNKLSGANNLDNTTQTTNNLSRELFKTILDYYPSRIQTILTEQYNNNDSAYKNIPFDVNDVLCMEINIQFKDMANLHLGKNKPDDKDYILRIKII